MNVARQTLRTVLGIASVLVLVTDVAAQSRDELYVVNEKPASVSILEAASWSLVGTMPLDPDPTAAVIDVDRRFLFVLHGGRFRPDGSIKQAKGQLVVYDLESRSRLRAVELGWNTTDLVFSGDGRYLLCLSEGKRGSKKPEEFGSTTVVDTRTAEVTARLPAGRFGLRLALLRDASRIFVLSPGEIDKKKNGAPSVLTVYGSASAEPLATIPLERASRVALSLDERWLYVLDGGWPSKNAAEHRNGVVHVLDTSTLAMVGSHDVGTQPRTLDVDPRDDTVTVLAQASFREDRGKLYRLHGADQPVIVDVGADPRYVQWPPDRSETAIVSHEDLRLLGNGRTETEPPLVLNPGKGASGPAGAKKLGGSPGELLWLPDQNRLAMSVTNDEGHGSKVAILDLRDNRIQDVITTGRGSVKFGKFMGAVAMSVAASAISQGIASSIAQGSGASSYYYNAYWFQPKAPNVTLAGSGDGAFLYALNTQTNDVTVVRLADGEVLDHIPVGGGCRMVGLAPGGRFMYAVASDGVTLIDTSTNEATALQMEDAGSVNRVYAFEPERRLVVLTRDHLFAWDADTGSLIRSADGFGEPFLLLDARGR